MREFSPDVRGNIPPLQAPELNFNIPLLSFARKYRQNPSSPMGGQEYDQSKQIERLLRTAFGKSFFLSGEVFYGAFLQ